ncbi:hypothetical protein [Stakelama marina]|uniref:RcnB family protein n=1 Tax=Stakelama marina TaxID=2826939 RepID=A0A8T4ID66_9SPHN|nr:hypothetical protein [Stakelama marina]MBR0551804.1 hypothetical protein [Stakelama marina]
MRNVLLATAALAFSVGAPAIAQDHGKGHANDHGNGNAAHGPEKHAGKSADEGKRGGPPERVREHGAKPGPQDRARAQPVRAHPQMAEDRGGPQPVARIQDRLVPGQHKQQEKVRREDRRDAGAVNDRGRHFERRASIVRDNGPIYRIERVRQRFVDGCPPGLAKKQDGCLPPGQAKKLASERPFYSNWWRRLDGGDANYRYDNGYLYRMRPGTNTVASYLPLLGGALSVGNVWPSGFSGTQVPAYYRQYYGYDTPYDYRYADGVMYGVNPQNNMIEQVAALLTGDNWNVGQPMPSGYGVYNVPYQYRSQYRDTPQSMYRYSDGYIYQVDPTTRIVQAAIQLLT